MERRKKLSWIAGGVALLAGGMLGTPVEAAPKLAVGKALPNLSVTDIDGKKHSLASLKNKPVWITFFNSH